MTLKRQALLAGGILLIGLILTTVFGSDDAAPHYHAFGYGMDRALGYGLGIYLSALPDAAALAWVIARACRLEDGVAICWPALIASVVLFAGFTTLIQTRIYPLMTSEWFVAIVLARLFAFFGAALLWAIPFQLWAIKDTQRETQVL